MKPWARRDAQRSAEYMMTRRSKEGGRSWMGMEKAAAFQALALA